VASVWITTRTTAAGRRRYRVSFRTGGRESRIRYGGSFTSRKGAERRARWVRAELDSMRLPDIRALEREREPRTMAAAAAEWQSSRIDVAANTRNVHRKSLAHVLAAFGEREPASLASAEVAAWVGRLSSANPPSATGRAAPFSPGYVRKIVDALAMVLDHEGIAPNPARDRRVRLPRAVREEIRPPSAEDVEAVLGAVAPRYRLVLVILDASGMRVGELEGLRWGDLDAAGGIVPPLPLSEWLGAEAAARRWRVAREREKGGRGRWVPVPADVFAAVDGLLPREDRDLEAPVLPWLRQASLRTEIARACRATGTALWSPHDLRHRRISLWHRGGVSWAQIGEWAGQRDLATTANRYTHVLPGREIDRGALIEGVIRHVLAPSPS
jgi:integrase